MNTPLSNQVAFVSGAGRGIGRAIAIALSQAGARVAVNDINASDAMGVVDEIRASGGGGALAVPGDVGDLATVEQLVAATVAEFGRLDLAISNAAYSDRESFYEADLAGFRRTIDVTMWGAFHVLRVATCQMLAQPPLASGVRGAIVIVSSPHAIQPIPHAMAYNMAKAAIDQMARTAAIELVGQHIRVNIMHPGWTDTPGERKFASDAELAETGRMLPWGRLARPDEIARGVVFLCDPRSEYVTGSTLLIDGGLSLPWWATGGSGVPDCGRTD